ncbi:MAG: hypothetical protein Q9179_007075 [Wetmoreana sp. 5 TL-2023]
MLLRMDLGFIEANKYSEPVRTFILKLKNALKDIETFISDTGPSNTTLELPLQKVDARVVDIIVAGGVRNNDEARQIIQLRRGLSQRSLAEEYRSWQGQVKQRSSVDKRVKTLKAVGRFGDLDEFLKIEEPRFGRQYKGSIRRAIDHGIKLLVLERLLGGIGYSAILIFRFTDFYNLKYENLEELVRALQDDNCIKKLASHSADWISQWQSKYDVGTASGLAPQVTGDEPTFEKTTLHSTSDTEEVSNNSEAASTYSSNQAATLQFPDAPNKTSQHNAVSHCRSVEHDAHGIIRSRLDQHSRQHGHDVPNANGLRHLVIQQNYASAAQQTPMPDVQGPYRSPYTASYREGVAAPQSTAVHAFHTIGPSTGSSVAVGAPETRTEGM